MSTWTIENSSNYGNWTLGVNGNGSFGSYGP